jgi:hypothetical protein
LILIGIGRKGFHDGICGDVPDRHVALDGGGWISRFRTVDPDTLRTIHHDSKVVSCAQSYGRAVNCATITHVDPVLRRAFTFINRWKGVQDTEKPISFLFVFTIMNRSEGAQDTEK